MIEGGSLSPTGSEGRFGELSLTGEERGRGPIKKKKKENPKKKESKEK